MKIGMIIVVIFLSAIQVGMAQLSPLWEGNWKGECRIKNLSNGPNPLKLVGMELQIKKKSGTNQRYLWQITYKTDQGKEIRPYELVYSESSKQYKLDEKNGISLDMFYDQENESLISHFSVDETSLFSEEKLYAGKLMVKIYSFHKPEIVNSSPQIQSYTQSTLQDCILNH